MMSLLNKRKDRMNKIFKEILLCAIIVCCINISNFILLIITSMDYQSSIHSSAVVFYYIQKYILGFPLVLIDADFPFFLDSNTHPGELLYLLCFCEFVFQIGVLFLLRKLYRKKNRI